MDKIITYTLQEEDLPETANGLVNLVLKNCVKVTGHEISAAKFLPNGITADGRLVHVSERILPGQTLRIILPEEQEPQKILPAWLPEGGKLEVLYEDDDLIIVNKPAGVVSHPSPGHYQDTMANYLAGYYCDRRQAASSDSMGMVCRLVGRLDKETSGALVFAKNRAACARLFRQRGEQAMQRTYYAIVHGAFAPDKKEGTIEGYLSSRPDTLMLRQVATKEAGVHAVTQYKVQRQDTEKNLALVECHILTGRTHQIRVHMASIGHPLLGDTLYGQDAQQLDGTGQIKSMPGEQHAFLHAGRVELTQPFTGQRICVDAPWPEDFRKVLEEKKLE